jgi:alpha-mannosidase
MANFDAERVLEIQQIESRLREIQATIYSQRQPIGGLEACVTGMGLGPERMPEAGWKPFAVKDRWGGYDQTTWFRMTARIPKSFAGQTAVALIRPSGGHFDPGIPFLSAAGEAMAFINGEPAHGLDKNHDEILLSKKAKGGETFQIAIEGVPSTRIDIEHHFQYADLAVLHPEAWNLYWDVLVPLKVYKTIGSGSAAARQLFDTLFKAIRLVDLQHLGTPAYYASCARASAFLNKALKRFEHGEDMGRLVLVGHSHIDTAWLWPLRETRRKVGRTFSTVLALMDRYPEYHFSCSQPELYMYVKEHFPELWKRIKKRAKEGRWEPCGAPWIEQDSNMPGGESLVRQFLYGNRFFEQEFGMRSHTAWLPDAFGYPWSLPQILKQCQIDTFITTKIDWGTFTKFPYSLFQWQGIDGTRIRALMPPMNYNGNPVPADLIAQWNLFKQRERVEELPFAFGWGDGGGGPTAEMLEHGRRLKNIIGVPHCEFGRTQDSLDRMVDQCPTETLPVYNDELYLELHRACQITQARTKRFNRKIEVALHDTEFIAALASLRGAAYDHAGLWKSWRTLLTNQFHDILPGSSITEVYTTAEQEYASALQNAHDVRAGALTTVLHGINTSGPGTPIVVFNTLSWVRSDIAEVSVPLPRGAFHVIAPDGSVVASQKIGKDRVIFEALNLPPLGHAVYHLVPGKGAPEIPSLLEASTKSLENFAVKVRLNGDGEFTQVYDKLEERDVLARGQKGNVLQLFDDRPFDHDAWDIDHNIEDEKQWTPGKALSVEVIEEGPVRAVVRVVRKTERSTITQDITLYALLPRVDVKLHADWHEKRVLMKVAFPVDVLSHRATYGIQYGAIERATHASREHERARFEVTGHHWADLSEGNYGISLLNDCKYSYDIKDNVMRLSLLRAPVHPDEHADQGEHDMIYSLYPHYGDWRYGAVQQGYALNVPLLACPAEAKPGGEKVASFASLDVDNVILDHIKKAEDSDALVLRLYEAFGQRGPVELTFGRPPRSVSLCDMMEENDQPVKTKENTVSLYFTPYEIKSLKVHF